MGRESDRILELLTTIYGDVEGREVHPHTLALIQKHKSHAVSLRAARLTHRDAMLITYGDQIREANVPPMQTLAEFCTAHLDGVVSGIHILPFYPYTSDDGFSVVDYKEVNPGLGNWHDITQLSHRFRLMFDAVINHISASSDWFRRFLEGDPAYRDYFIVAPEGADVSKVVRPRALPLLTRFSTSTGEKAVWTTFSEDQIDLNYANPRVLLEILDTLLFYVTRGAEFLRLDAIAFLWKEYGTRCVHLPKTHALIRLMREVIEQTSPWVKLITETNVPHKDNVSYFGDGTNEAHLVYNFALPPLTVHTLHTGRSDALTRWAAGLSLPSRDVTFFNFLASHDGIGLNPARGILTDDEIHNIVSRVQAHNGLVSYKANPDGTKTPYELNVNYFDALSDPNGNEPLSTQVARFMVAQSIMLTMIGLPGIYFHSLFGSRGWPQGVKETGRNRTINRQKVERGTVENELRDPTSLRHQVFTPYRAMLIARASSRAFDPYGDQEIIEGGNAIFAVLRRSPAGSELVLCLHNVSNKQQTVTLNSEKVFGRYRDTCCDLLSDFALDMGREFSLSLSPYQVMWLSSSSPHDR